PRRSRRALLQGRRPDARLSDRHRDEPAPPRAPRDEAAARGLRARRGLPRRGGRLTRWRIEEGDLELARAAVRRHAKVTPLEPCAQLGPGAFLKLETEQLTGSFKLRGALAALSALPQGARVVTASAGNHGYGLATAGAILGVEVTVFVSRAAPAVKREGIARAGARVELVDAGGYDDVEALAREAASERGLVFV